MKCKTKQWVVAIAAAVSTLFAGGCGGINSTGTLSPLMFIQHGDGGAEPKPAQLQPDQQADRAQFAKAR